MDKMLKNKVRQRLISEYGWLFSGESIDREELRAKIRHILEDTIRREQLSLSEQEKNTLAANMIDELTGFGPLESLLKDPHITEIMVNGMKNVYVEKNGKTVLSNIKFDDEEELMYLVYKILAPTRRRVDESFPYTEVSLADGSRVNIVIPPLALDGPAITIRKFSKEIKSIEDLVNLGTMDRRMSQFLIAAIKAKANIIFSGATGVGKTTTLNVLSSYIPDDSRIVTIEDTAELRLNQEHVVRLETRQTNIEGKGEVTIRDLFKNSLRMRPDRIILGEIRSVEALDMLQAICSGHSGSLSVLHASSPQDVIYRLETMILTSGLPLGLEIIHRQIAAAVNLIVQQEQLLDGSRKITCISQVNGLKNDGQINLEDIFIYEQDGIDPGGAIRGRWVASGIIPVFYPLFKKLGIGLPQEIFNKG